MADVGGRHEFSVKVNGIEFEVTSHKLLAREILQLASEHGAMPGKPENYILQGDKGLYDSDAWVELEVDDTFITIPDSPTPVA